MIAITSYGLSTVFEIDLIDDEITELWDDLIERCVKPPFTYAKARVSIPGTTESVSNAYLDSLRKGPR